MSDFGFFDKHRTWEDWFGMLLGLLILLSPWFPGPMGEAVDDSQRRYIILNSFAVGLLVIGLAQLEYVALQRWQEVTAIFVALWLILSPYLFGYFADGWLRFYHSSLGGLVLLLAALQLWQDWELSDREMLEHGR